jgi:hypothetical protein
MLKPKTSFERFLNDCGLMSLLNSASTQAPSPPKFPSFAEVVKLEEAPKEQKGRSSGLFDALIREVAPLYQETLEHPEKFTPEGTALVTELAAGTKRLATLTRTERELLDLATIDFAAATPKKKPRRAPPRPAPAPREPPKAELPIGGVDVPEGTQDAYWWLR